MAVLESRHPILTNWMDLIEKLSPIESLADILLDNGTLTHDEYNEIFESDDKRHNLRLFLFTLDEKDPSILAVFIKWLEDNNHYDLIDLLKTNKTSGCIPFHSANDEVDQTDEKSSSIEANYEIPIDNNTEPLKIKLNLSDQFLDTKADKVGCYYSRSKCRGRVLIINNFDFPGTEHKFRRGAAVDQENLIILFTQMGGWEIESHSNKTAGEMKVIIEEFAKYEESKICDICFVFIMSHGSDNLNGTIIYGKDGQYITPAEIDSYFTTEKCKLYRGKPKIFIFQVCRGNDIDIGIKHTESDSSCSMPSRFVEKSDTTMTVPLRPIEDMLIGYATLHGSKAHRDPDRGTWYIEIICYIFMRYAYELTVDDLLIKVDMKLRERFSELFSTQTSETHNRGFKKLYLNPGIYEEDGRLEKYS